MKKLGVLVLAAGMLLGVSGCGNDRVAEMNNKSTRSEFTLHLSDGREVLCIQVQGISYGLSCDWDNAK